MSALASNPAFTLASWNVNSLNVRLSHVQQWLAATPVDVLGMQELKLPDERFPAEALREQGYDAAVFGQATYNGVALLHRPGANARDVQRNLPGYADAQSRVIAATLDTPLGDLRVVNAYFVNGQEPGSEKFAYKREWLGQLHAYMQAQLQAHERVVLMGDFNIAAEDADSWDPDGLRGTIHHTDEERQAFADLLALGLCDAFRAFEQPAKTFSWWDYRMLAFQKNRGLRIDYILISDALRPLLRRCWIDRAPRKWPKPSDHAPVLVELGEPGASGASDNPGA